MAKEPPGGHEVPQVPSIPTAGPGAGGAPAPTAWEPGASRSPYAAPPRGGPPPAGSGSAAPPGPPRSGAGPDLGFAMPQMARPPLDGVAVASVVTGALGTGPVALALGLLGLRRTTRSYRRSPRIAATGVVLGSVGTIAWAVVGVVAAVGGFPTGGGTAEPGDVPESRIVHSSLVAPGNCVEFLPAQQEVGEVTLVPCATPHVAQALTTWEVDDATYPGPEGALEAAAAICGTELADRGLDDAEHLPWWFVPTPQAWDAGERTATCLVRSSGSLLTTDLVG